MTDKLKDIESRLKELAQAANKMDCGPNPWVSLLLELTQEVIKLRDQVIPKPEGE